VAVHFWPAYPIAAPATVAAVDSRSASARTSEAFSPPISAWQGMPRATEAAATERPAATEPVKETTSASSTTARPAPVPPVTTWTSPAGRAWPSSSARRTAQALASGAGLSSTALPKASAGASFHSGIASGKFHGVTSPASPCGRRRASSSDRPSAAG
jgi:hypothetical protein